MQPELRSSGSSSRDTLGQSGTLILGDGSSAGLVIVPRSLLGRICAHIRDAPMDGNAASGGLLFGPEPQSEDLLVEDAIPLGTPFSREQSQTIIGFYRALTRGSETSDQDVLAGPPEVPPSTLRCCFLLRPLSDSEVVLTVLMRDPQGWREIQEITLDTVAVSQRIPERIAEHRIAAPPPPAVTPVPRRRGAVVPTLGLLSIAAVAGAYLWVSQRPNVARGSTLPETQAVSRTGFSANRDGSAWKLTWDSAAVEAMKPTGAVLSIQDGAGQQDIPLTTADLSSGTIYYSPKSGELAFRLQLQRDGVGLVEERVRVLDGIKPASTVPLSVQTPDVRASRPVGDVFRPNPAPPPPAADEETNRLPQRRTPARAFVPPGRGAVPQSSPVLAEGEPITTLAIPAPGPSQFNATFTAAPAPPPPAPVKESAPEPQAAQNVPPPTTIPATPAPQQSTYIAPRPIRQVQPRWPSGVTPGPAEVQVRVSINEKGKVTKIGLVGSTPSSPVMIEASKAAGLWEFEPARFHGQAVASEMTLIFRFNR
jgi:hypothetical protein